jgi:diaminohydroxyphosphoribosylaminopyrimidine deaminase / 5-amino-6-(5-phosphoribosylamino)uracil reductase
LTGQSTTPGDSELLRLALALAEGGRGRVSPNPLVGALVVRDGEVIGQGFHAELGGPHAERAALADAAARGEEVAGATMYVTLEPCAHQGRQPPCSEAVIEAGIARVVIAADDPTAKAAGRGPEQLRAAGIAVEFIDDEQARTASAGGPGAAASGTSADADARQVAAAARLQNQPFRKHGRTGLPWVLWKTAMSLDGRTTTPDGASPWISGERSRDMVHVWRGECDAIAVGIGTAIADDPLLTARRGGAPAVGPGAVAEPGVGDTAAADSARRAAGDHAAATSGARGPTADRPPALRQPTRVVFDSAARLPLDSRLLATTDEAPLLVVTGPDADLGRLGALRDKGAETIVAAGATSAERIAAALGELGRRGLTSLLLEGGATLAAAFAAADQIDEARVFVAPMVLGGPMPDVPMSALQGGSTEAENVGEDTLIRTRFKEW